MCHKVKVYGGIYRTRQSPPHLFADEKPPSKWDVSLINYEPNGKSRVRKGIALKRGERQKTLSDRRGESQERTRTARDRRAIGPTERAERTRRNRLQFHQVSQDFRRGGGRALPRPDAASVPAKQKGRQRKRGGGARPSRRASIGRDRRRAVASPSSGPPTNLPAPRP